MKEEPPDTFVESFRGSAPYIHAHRGRTFVLVVGGEVMKSPGLRSLVHDIALLSSLGVRLVLCVGARPQIDERIALRGKKARFVEGIRVTDKVALECVKESAGTNRVELEALLSMGLPSSPMAGARLRVVAGNFVSARPLGVIEGVDYQYTGEVRRVDAEAIRTHLDSGAVVILTPIGYSITGEAFNVSTHDLAAAAAVALRADKLICLVEGKGVVDRRGRLQHELTPEKADALLAQPHRLARDVELHLQSAVRACRRGVRRAHLVSRRIDGGLLRELFTRDGIGTLVSEQQFEGVRAARPEDVAGILELIEPLERQGILVRRPRDMLERDIGRFTVIERDGLIVACAAVYPYPEENIAELACVAVHPHYREAGRADVLLQYIERICREDGLARVFVLTTRTAHWFLERGFEPSSMRLLPAAKRALYDKKRRSKVFVKALL